MSQTISNFHRKLTDDDVQVIRQLFWSGECSNKSELSRRYGVAYNTIRSVLRRFTFTHAPHVEGEPHA